MTSEQYRVKERYAKHWESLSDGLSAGQKLDKRAAVCRCYTIYIKH
jgi:hypothetical protein